MTNQKISNLHDSHLSDEISNMCPGTCCFGTLEEVSVLLGQELLQEVEQIFIASVSLF